VSAVRGDPGILQHAPSETIERLGGKTLLVTGATGLLGYNLVRLLSQIKGSNRVRIIALARDRRKTSRLFSNIDTTDIEFVYDDVCRCADIDGSLDFIIHTASPTRGQFFIENPVETIETIVMGTKAVLELAKDRGSESVVYLSSMEAYGISEVEEYLSEEHQGYLDPLAIRSSYPQAKRTAEALCAAFAKEYSVPVKIVRLAQVVGDSVVEGDTRIMAQLAQCFQSQADIVLETDGSSKQTYIGLRDTMTAILFVLLRGDNGQAYNAANENTYCSIREMADFVADVLADKKIAVKINAGDTTRYPPKRSLRLSSAKLCSLGWVPTENLEVLLSRLVAS
jgi:nucleoside-diphosphate-sugar epimerase